jgi:hypothetical protein
MPVNMAMGGTARTHGWTTDLTLDAAGTPHAIFTSRVNSSSADHRLYYGKWTGSQWQVTELAKAGAGLYTAEGDYTGLGAIDPRNPSTVYISTNFTPGSGAPLAKREIFKGVTPDGGASWNWTPITQDSSVDNIRPIIPAWDNGTAVMWLRGQYTTYTNYNMAVVGLVEKDGEQVGAVRYTDATAANTTLSSGAAFAPAGPSDDFGSDTDGNWTRFTQIGNGGESLAASEAAPADAPRLKTTIANVAPGTYDVFAFFWGGDATPWQVSAGLTEGEMRLFRDDQVERAVAEDFDGAVTLFSNSGIMLHKAYLGRTTLGAAGALSVFIDDVPGSGPTLYDGIGLAPVLVPEPSAVFGVVAAAAGALLCRRRHRIRLA